MRRDRAIIPRAYLIVMLLVVLSIVLGGCAEDSGMTKGKGSSKAKDDAATVAEEDDEAIVASKDDMAVEAATLAQKTTILEYSRKTTDITSLVECSDSSVNVRVKKDIDLSVIGEQTAVFELSRGDASRSVEVAFLVEDTHAPKISIEQDYVNLEYGVSYDPGENVICVEDPVDGTAERVAEEPTSFEMAWYVVRGAVDTGIPGEYPITIDACDINGNRSSRDYTVVVSAPPVEQPTTTSSTAAVSDGTGGQNPFPDQGLPPATTAYVLNTNTMKFHHPSCRDVKKIAEHNRVDVDATREEVISQGYDPCGHCNP